MKGSIMQWIHGSLRPGGVVLILLLLFLFPLLRGVQAETVERIVALVEDKPILLSEVQGRLMLEIEQRGIDPGDSATVHQVRELIIDGLIEQRVLELYASEAGLSVSDEQVTQAVEAAIARNKEALGSEELFRMQLEREGLTEAELRQRFAEEARRTMLAERVVETELGSPPEVTPEEVRRYYDEHRDELPAREASLHLQRLVILVEPDSSLIERTRLLAAQVAAQIRAGELTFAEAAERYSDDPNTRRSAGDLHQLSRGDLAGNLGRDFEQQVFALEAGTISEPLRSPLGYHVFAVREHGPEGQWVQAGHILFSLPIVQSDRVAAEQQALRVHARATEGADFADLARRYSDAPEAEKGGDLGWIPWRLLEEPLQQALEGLDSGQVSEVIPLEGAFIIVRHLGREGDRPYEFNEIEAELTEHVREVRMEERYREWMAGLKQRHYVERRAWE
ncbi:MAG: peptidylprolyl isomerase [Candidatus Eisenbacteria bacterium]